jgi:hypothetical protein
MWIADFAEGPRPEDPMKKHKFKKVVKEEVTGKALTVDFYKRAT